ncbi:MAG: hypothetical protein HYU37_03260 [Acidobacteria bacterium]|nr:hypothetical protein [Acidobacteriota bacterium]
MTPRVPGAALLAACLAALAGAHLAADAARLSAGIASRVFVVERNAGSLAVYDLADRRVIGRIEGLGNLQHAVMTFSRWLDFGYIATRSGRLTRIDLQSLERAGEVQTSKSSIDIAISQDGRFVATAEYAPGGVTILDARTLDVVRRIPGQFERDGQVHLSRVTGIVDAPGNRFVCVLIEGAEIWVIDASGAEPVLERRIPTAAAEPYDAMITPDGRYYVVAHLDSADVTVLDLDAREASPRVVSLREPGRAYDQGAPRKLPHLASWAVAQGSVFVPLVGEKRLAVLDRDTWAFKRSIELRGHPVYAVRAPGERHVWVTFSGEADDAFVQVVDVGSLEVVHTFRVGARIYHVEFTPRGSHALITANAEDTLFLVNARTYAIEDRETLRSPSGVFGLWRAFTMGL